MNEKFLELPEEKQLAIINAAMEVFSQNEFKRASTDLIASKAGVSKGLLFYYFHNKKELFLFLYNYTVNQMKEQVIDEEFFKITDYFELLTYSATKKVRILHKNPYIMDFAMRTFYSEKEIISDDLQKFNTTQANEMYQEYFSKLDYSKFRPDAEPQKIHKLLVWMADGYIHEKRMTGNKIELDELMNEFQEWMKMMKQIFYKEEYVNESN